MPARSKSTWLHRFAVLTAAATFCLIGIGGLVTSHGAGMAVPDWPTSYGYSMFLFPASYWIGGIFYEHTHRLFASFVGLLTTILAVWLWLKEPRRWMRWLGLIAFASVLSQGVIGGLRVVLSKDQIGIAHATLAQIFLLETTGIALFTSNWWNCFAPPRLGGGPSRAFRSLAAAVTLLIFAQLILGAVMRHQHAGLAVPDFPLAYGRLWPRMDAAFIQQINAHRVDARDFNPIAAWQIGLHMAHRLTALLVLGGVLSVFLRARREFEGGTSFNRLALAWLFLVLIQAGLGAATVWSHKAADVATLHVMGGALSLVTGAILCAVSFRWPRPLTQTQPQPHYCNQTLISPAR